MAGLSPLGSDWPSVRKALLEKRSAVEFLPELGEYKGMDTRLAARVSDFLVPDHYPRKRTRSMGRVALMAARATELALVDAGLEGAPVLSNGRTGISYGSTAGRPPAKEVFALRFHAGRSLEGIRATDYVQFMSHTVAANLAQFFEIRGRVLSSCSACTSGSQGIGFGYEMVQSGKQDVVIAGGAEEYHPIDSAVFDIMYATSKRNAEPHTSPRPFDRDRDGLVVAEGAGTLILEALDHARARGAHIHAEVVGYGTNCDGLHITAPHAEGMQRAMELALEDAELEPAQIGYVNAHGTATPAGDIAESLATARVFGGRFGLAARGSLRLDASASGSSRS
jgi:3-oxoacyl-[acyl-carrier-protein] synthase II